MSKRRIVIKGQDKPERPAPPTVVLQPAPVAKTERKTEGYLRIIDAEVRAEAHRDTYATVDGRQQSITTRIDYTAKLEMLMDEATFRRMQEFQITGQLDSILERAINGGAE